MFNRWRRQGLVIIFRPLASGFLCAGEQGTETSVLLWWYKVTYYIWFAQQSLVGWWPPCPILPHPNSKYLFSDIMVIAA